MVAKCICTLSLLLGGIKEVQGFSDSSAGKESAYNAGDTGDMVWSLGQEDTLEEDMATQSSILARKIPWTEEPGILRSIGLQRIRHNWVTKHI